MARWGRKKTALFLGDSLTEWCDWAGRFPGIEAHNLGVSGETVQGILRRLPSIVRERPGADMVFLMTGINDLASDEPPLEVAGHIVEALGVLRASYVRAVIYAQGLLPTLIPWIPPGAIARVNAEVRAMASHVGATYVDLHAAFIEGRLEELLSPDGIHLSPRGYDLWAGLIEPLINK